MWSLEAVPAAAAPVAASVAAVEAAAPVNQYRALVRRLKDKDPRWEVRSAARNAYLMDTDEAATAFFSAGGGYDEARKRASSNAARNDLIISRAIATSHPSFSPFVHMTATRAQYGTLDEKDRYVRTGLAEAKALDAKHSPVEQAKQQTAMDREYVADLATNASGAWVKEAALRAVRLGTDADIAEFFKYSWASAADCDLQAFRLRVDEQEATYRQLLGQAVLLAEQAQAAYEGAAEAAKVKAAEEARSAWHTAADVAASTQATWSANQDLNASQARAWQAVHDFAVQATTDQNWAGIADRATSTSTSWAEEVAWSQEQARRWTELEVSIRAHVYAIPVITPAPANAAGI